MSSLHFFTLTNLCCASLNSSSPSSTYLLSLALLFLHFSLLIIIFWRFPYLLSICFWQAGRHAEMHFHQSTLFLAPDKTCWHQLCIRTEELLRKSLNWVIITVQESALTLQMFCCMRLFSTVYKNRIRNLANPCKCGHYFDTKSIMDAILLL